MKRIFHYREKVITLLNKTELSLNLFRFLFILYITLVGLLIFKHEPWFDEAQAWLLARDLNPVNLFCKYLRYESSPGLWHLILMIPAKLHFPYISLNIISGIIAIIGVYIFLRFAPFPSYIKVLFPFSFYIFYQYAVVARAYVLLPLLLFLIARIYKNRYTSFWLFSLLLLLQSLVSLHGTMITIAILLIHYCETFCDRSQMNNSLRRKHLIAVLFFFVLFVSIAFELWLPKDVILGGSQPSQFFILNLSTIIQRFFLNVTDAFITNFTYSQITPFTPFFLALSAFILYASLRWFHKQKLLTLYISINVALFPLFSLNYAAPWHQGILFLVWVFVLWISFEQIPKNTEEIKFQKIISLLFLFILSVQIYWSICTFNYDYHHYYSGSRQMAQYIQKNHLENKRIFMKRAGNIEILPYFQKNIFINYNNNHLPGFWFWSKNSWLNDNMTNFQKEQPEYLIVYFNRILHPNDLTSFNHYCLIKLFQGGIYWKDVIHRGDSYAIYQKVSGTRFPLPKNEIVKMIFYLRDN